MSGPRTVSASACDSKHSLLPKQLNKAKIYGCLELGLGGKQPPSLLERLSGMARNLGHPGGAVGIRKAG